MKIHHSHVHGESIAKKKSECVSCSESFKYYPSEKPGKYCSSCVESGQYIDTSGLEQYKGLSGKDNPNYRGGSIEPCTFCGGEDWFSPSDKKKNDNLFCSDDCYRMWQSEQYQGAGNPNWKGGYNPNYSDGWWTARRKALERDDYTCQLCGADESPSGRTCDVHHKKPVREFYDPSDAHFLDNLVTLCRTCHASVEKKDRKI